MPLVRNVLKVGNSRAVVLPAEWLEYYERVLGRQIDTVLMEISGDHIMLRVDDCVAAEVVAGHKV